MRVPVQVGDKHFKTKIEAVEFLRGIVRAHLEGAVMTDENQRFLMALFETHERYEQKRGPGVDHIEIRRGMMMGAGWTLFAILVDGTEMDFSYKSCFGKRKFTIEGACRLAVTNDIIAFKHANLGSRCPLSGELLVHGSCEVDHEAPWTFVNLVRSWIEENHIIREHVVLARGGAGEISGRFQDRELEESFLKYHRQHAKLRLLHVDAHRALTTQLSM